MNSLFVSENLGMFFDILHASADDYYRFRESCQQAISLIAEELSIGYMEAHVHSGPTVLRPTEMDEVIPLYRNETFVPITAEDENAQRDGMDEESTHPETVHREIFKTLNQGEVKIVTYAKAGCVFTEDILVALHEISGMIFQAGSRASMNKIVTQIMMTDVASGIPNLNAFLRKVGMYIRTGLIRKYVGFFYNVKNFKYVNKVLSYTQGDDVMRKYAGTVSSFLEENEILARLGGDNYVALVRRENKDEFIHRLQTVTIAYDDGMHTREFHFGAWIGWSYLDQVEEPGQVMMQTSIAYQVAKAGKGVVEYTPEIYGFVMHEKEIAARFYPALQNHEFEVFYQPKVDARDYHICGAEALVRWRRKGQLILPREFIGILEKDGSVIDLDFYVLEKTCQSIRRWMDQGLPIVRVSTNFSRRHLTNPHLVDEIVDVIDKYRIDHKYIEIEITESEDYRDYQAVSEIVKQLRENNICISIDDFGVGYSSLNMLKSTSFDVLKIDKSFVPRQEEYEQRDKDLIMFTHIIEMARQLGMTTIIEGVEEEKQLRYVQEVGCDLIQGFLFDQPMPEEEFIERLRRKKYDEEFQLIR